MLAFTFPERRFHMKYGSDTHYPITLLFSIKQSAERFTRFDALYRIAEGVAYRYDFNLIPQFAVGGNGVGDEKLLDGRCFDGLYRISREYAVRRRRIDFTCAAFHEEVRCARECATGICHVVDNECHLALHIADELHAGNLIRYFALFVDDGEVGRFHEALRIRL